MGFSLSNCCFVRHYHTVSIDSLIENVITSDDEIIERPQFIQPFIIHLSLVLSLIGLWGNVLIVMATILSRQLQSRTHILMGIMGGTDFVICVYLVQLRIFMLNRWYSVPNSNCFLSSIAGLIALNIQSGMTIVIAIDRLAAVMTPTKYDNISVHFYYYLVSAVLFFSFLLTGFGFLETDESLTTICMSSTAYVNNARFAWIGSNFIISVVGMVIVGLAHHKYRRLKEQSSLDTSNLPCFSRLLNSLSIVVAVYSFTTITTVLCILVTKIFLPNTSQMLIDIHIGWLVIINSSSNFFIYFWKVPEYRRAFIFLITCGRCGELDGSPLNTPKFPNGGGLFGLASMMAMSRQINR